MKTSFFLLTVLACIPVPSCELIEQVTLSETADGTVYYWISADADTYVECTTIGGGCTGGETDNTGRDGLVVAHNGFTIKRSYVNFPKASFPAGTRIEEAYFELYHSGKNEDGKTDNINLKVTRVGQPWNAGDLTYANQPVPTGSGGEFNLRLESQAWSGTQDISFSMQQGLVETGNFEGFVTFISSFEPGYEKGFYSGNHSSRTLGDLGFAPRLLLKVTLPAGTTTDDVDFNTIHPDGNNGNFFGIEFRNTPDWPADWDLAIRD